ncbi:peroxisome-assembly ATPase [Malassezia vespertilionis]|uniref:Afg1p n=1 Tax=Malassezia vespertilionis TaxID=2020962 RepID=A0A2N1JDU1_9BASI|nr:peroxisome-assembly ATPase [Malassezia vespertilionis]PKI84719.1 hypothetical protein MVES_001325 [Malassezia vespertilionis]WFD06066.1 peroxisome-assembly ATPase [Malassezia vespertilionis]
MHCVRLVPRTARAGRRFFSAGHASRAEPSGPLETYRALVQEGRLRDDAHQVKIVEQLQTLHEQLKQYEQVPVPAPEEGIKEREPPQTGMLSSILRLLPLPEQEAGRMEQSKMLGVTRDMQHLGVFGHLASFFSHKKEDTEEPTRPENVPQSMYLYGDVGCGKSMVMDLFFNTLPPNVTRKRRIHFHQFMIDVHKRSHYYKSKYHRASGIVGQAVGTNETKSSATAGGSTDGGEIDPIEPVIREIAGNMEVLCFDEFQVVDIVDAMILRRILEGLMRYGVVIVTTSNRAPSELYKNGIQRSSFIPCIHLIEHEYCVVNLDSGTDYRKVPQARHQTYFLENDLASRKEFDKLFKAMTDGEPLQHNHEINVWGRALVVPECTSKVAKFTFMGLCGQPRSAADYIALCNEFSTIFIEDIPLMSMDMRDLARRFITFIDAAYESKTRIFTTSEVELVKAFSGGVSSVTKVPDQMRALMDDLKMTADDIGGSSIFTGDEELFAFARLLSRLSEMATQLYMEASARR